MTTPISTHPSSLFEIRHIRSNLVHQHWIIERSYPLVRKSLHLSCSQYTEALNHLLPFIASSYWYFHTLTEGKTADQNNNEGKKIS